MLALRSLKLASTILCLLFGSAADATSSTSTPCQKISALLPGQVAYPNSPSYLTSIQGYFNAQERLSPSCIVLPKCASDVATAVKALSKIYSDNPDGVKAAVKSGGHSPNAGAANVDDGVTIDLSSLNLTTVNENKSLVTVGAGNRWNMVYDVLDPMKIAVAGGRVAGIGVGGLLTGGGISYFSAERGWACDGIDSMEVVLASGEIVRASADSNPDLFTALKGGSNNFGIVTSFDLVAFPHGNMLGGAVTYPVSTVGQGLEAFNTYLQPDNFDPKAAIIQAFAYVAQFNSVFVSTDIEYTVPVMDPPVMKVFTDITPQLGSTLRITNLSDIVLELASVQPAAGESGLWTNTVFRSTSDAAILHQIYSLYNDTLLSVKDVANIEYSLIFQRLPTTLPDNTNSLGLGSSAAFSVLCQIQAAWADPNDDELMYKTTHDLYDKVQEATKAAGLYERFEYSNYGAPYQDILASYGEESLENMRAVSKKYDPEGFFQKAFGGFKLSRAGSS